MARTVQKGNAHRVWWKNLKESDLARPSSRRLRNVKTYLKATEWEDWINLSEGSGSWRAVVNTAMNIWVPVHAANFFTS